MVELIPLAEAAALIKKPITYTRFLIAFFEIPCQLIDGRLVLNKSVFIRIMQAHGFEIFDSTSTNKKRRKQA